MDTSILSTLPAEVVEGITLYRLGVFDNTSMELVELKAGTDYPAHYHKNSRATFFFIRGRGTISIASNERHYAKCSQFDIPKGTKHGFKPETDTLFLSMQTPPIKNQETGEEDLHY